MDSITNVFNLVHSDTMLMISQDFAFHQFTAIIQLMGSQLMEIRPSGNVSQFVLSTILPM